MHFNEQWVRNKKQHNKFLELDENRNTVRQASWETEEAVLRKRFRATKAKKVFLHLKNK